MSVDLISAAIIILACSGIPGLFLRIHSPWIGRLHVIFTLLGSTMGLTGAIRCFFISDTAIYFFFWPSVQGALVGVDSLSAFFLIPVLLVGGLGAVYGLGYWSPHKHGRTAAQLRFFWGLTLAGMSLLLISKHAMSFLLGWETMALAAFFLVSTENEKAECRRSGLIYLLATHLGTLLLLGFFSLWYRATGSMALVPATFGLVPAVTANILFLLALFGFGLKAGMMPLHFWLPGAHANAPSHVSALLSGVLLKMGIYGIIRVAILLPGISLFWGWLILALGAVSGILGVVFALAQHDLKRLLAYHSVENIGIILMGLGMALLGRSEGRMEWVVLGMAGCLLHVWNHSLFKSLLFMGAGSILHQTGTRQIDRLGGLAKKMPWTAAAFLLGAVAISGLPPLNGFISELFIYLGFFSAAKIAAKNTALVLLGAPVLAMIGALAVSCFVKVYGAVFLGSPRSESATKARESLLSLRIPMVVLAGLCLIIGIFPVMTVPFINAASKVWLGSVPAMQFLESSTARLTSLVPFAWLSIMMALTLLPLGLLGLLFFRNPTGGKSVTWDCGYARPTARMQYTAGSLARSLTRLFGWVLKPREHEPHFSSSFPGQSRLDSHVDDPVLDRFLIPWFVSLRDKSRWFYRFQQGQSQSYILYMALTLAVLLATQIPLKQVFMDLFSK